MRNEDPGCLTVRFGMQYPFKPRWSCPRWQDQSSSSEERECLDTPARPRRGAGGPCRAGSRKQTSLPRAQLQCLQDAIARSAHRPRLAISPRDLARNRELTQWPEGHRKTQAGMYHDESETTSSLTPSACVRTTGGSNRLAVAARGASFRTGFECPSPGSETDPAHAAPRNTNLL